MRYLVIRMANEAQDLGPAEEPGDTEAVVSGVVLCETTSEVCVALNKISASGDDWSVWEIVGKKVARRAVVFKMDGRAPYDVEFAK